MRGVNPESSHPVLNLLEKCKGIYILQQAHAQMITTGLISHTYPVSRILVVSSALATVSYTLEVFRQFPSPSIFLYNILISSLVQKGHHQVALSLYGEVLSEPELRPNDHTYPSLFKALGAQQMFRHGVALHAHVIKFLSFPYDNFVQASMLNFYSRCGKVGTARWIFDQIKCPDLASWNSMLSAYAHVCDEYSVACSGLDGSINSSMEVLRLFSLMQKASVDPNEISLVALITACANLGVLSQGMWAHAYGIRSNINLNHFIQTALITMYSNSGCLGFARQVFQQLPFKDTFCFNAMIRGLAMHGHFPEALDLFQTMKVEGFVPDDLTILAVLSVCSHAGLVDQGREIFCSMTSSYGLVPNLGHYCCLVDLLGRSGRIEEAQGIILTMSMKPNSTLWRCLLGAARVHGNLEVGEAALTKLLELEPASSGNYILLANMYAHLNRWDDVNRVRKQMKDHGINKMPGVSFVEVNGAMHEFLIGDRSHPRERDIYLKISEMNAKLQEYGHRSRAMDVLFDIEEEEKEDSLLYHSERLALAFALIASEPHTTIRIIKNLRVCVDCHSSTKLLSLIYGREIIVRDRVRFHCFKNGSCSCSDYW